MQHNLGTEKVSRLLWQLSIPAILGMLSSAIFNIVDRIFVGKISSNALTAVGITMPIQVLQMAFILLIGVGSSALISIKLGEGKKEEAEDILFLSFRYIILFLIGFAVLFVLFIDPILTLLSISEQVRPYAKTYIEILMVGAIFGIPGYCLNNSLRSIGQAKVTMKIIMATSILNMVLDPLFIYGFDLGIVGAAYATVISQTVLTIYVVYVFCNNKEFMIRLKRRKVTNQISLAKQMFKMGLPSFYVQILATVVNVFINNRMLAVGSDLDIAAVTIMSTIYSFYHMVVFGIVQGNNAICGYNWGAKQYGRVRSSLKLALVSAFMISTGLFCVIELFPGALVSMFAKEHELVEITKEGIRIYLCMLPILGLHTISSQYFQAVGKANRSSMLSFLRYGVIVVPVMLVLTPIAKVKGIYLSNAISDGVASIIAIVCIVMEVRRLKKMEQNQVCL